MTVRHWLAGLGAGAALAAALAACTAGTAEPTSPPGAVSGAPSATAAAASAPATSPASSPGAGLSGGPPAAGPTLPAEPPTGSLAGLAGLAAGTSAAGRLGSYTWAGGGTDAPWIVAPESLEAAPGAPLTASFGSLVPETWTAAWARVADGLAGDPTGGSAGSGIVTVGVPSAAGDWSLSVTAWFGQGANATYYWRIRVIP